MTKNEGRIVWESSVSNQICSDYWGRHSLSANEALLCWHLLLAASNQFPASLLSPELFLLASSLGDTLKGELALLLAGSDGCSAVGSRPGRRLEAVPDAGGLCRRETDLCAGGRRGWC